LISSKEYLARKITALLRLTGTIGVARSLLAGQGAIFLLHEVQENPAAHLSTALPTGVLDWMLGWLRREGWDIISLSEAVERLCQGECSARRFAVFTFDDGYKDNFINALPIMEKHNAPFTVYVPTQAISRELYSWWLGLRELFLKNDIVDLSSMGRRFECSTLAEKTLALQCASDWVNQDYSRANELNKDFLVYNLSAAEINEKYFLSKNLLRKISKHPLVTIGGHTTSHVALSCLDTAAALKEIRDNKQYLQSLLDTPVDHFAYPYGVARACSLRDAELVASAGYKSAVTARFFAVPNRVVNMHFLPRIEPPNDIDHSALDGRASGIFPFLAKVARSIGLMEQYIEIDPRRCPPTPGSTVENAVIVGEPPLPAEPGDPEDAAHRAPAGARIAPISGTSAEARFFTTSEDATFMAQGAHSTHAEPLRDVDA